MKNMKRAERKRQVKRFAIGDLVTWGSGKVFNRIVHIGFLGVMVDVTDEPRSEFFAKTRPDGRRHMFVAYDGNNRQRGGRGPIRKVP